MSKTLPARLTVLRTEQLTPTLRRVIFGGDGFSEFAERDLALNGGAFTDKYVKLVFLADGYDYPEPLNLEQVRETMPQDAWPVLRTYTIRSVDHEAHEVAVDFVIHGDEGFAGPWANAAQPGDVLHLRGPSGAYAPDPTADWHLFVGDEAGLPAISSALEALEPGAKAVAFVEVNGPDDELPLTTAADLEVHWLHRGDAGPGTTTLLDDAVRAWPVARRPTRTRSSTASRRCSRAFARTCSTIAQCLVATPRSRATGAAARPRRASGSGSPSRQKRSSGRGV